MKESISPEQRCPVLIRSSQGKASEISFPTLFIESNAIGALSRYSAKRNLHHADFYCQAPQAKRVSIIGDFNGWDPNASPMTRQPDGRWMVSLELTHGYHQYLFLVDGKRVLDPNATGKARNKSVSFLKITLL